MYIKLSEGKNIEDTFNNTIKDSEDKIKLMGDVKGFLHILILQTTLERYLGNYLKEQGYRSTLEHRVIYIESNKCLYNFLLVIS